MDLRHTASFQLTTDVMLEAMFKGGSKLIRGRQWVPILIHMVALTFLAPLGLLSLLWPFFGDTFRGYPLILPGMIVLAGLFFVWVHRQGHVVIAQFSAASRFNQKSDVTFTADGMILMAPQSEWKTGWGDVEAVLETKKAISIIVAGLVLPVPKDALDDPDAVFADIVRWHEAAQ